MTQPPLTRQIQLLEHEIGVQLLERSGGGVRLTSAGQVFLREAEDVLRRAQAATVAARRAALDDTGDVTLGFVPPAGVAVLPTLLSLLDAALPDVRLALREMQTDDHLEALGGNRVDLAVVRPFTPRSYVESAVLLREPMVLAIPVSHHLAKDSGGVPIGALHHEPFIEFSSSESRYLYEVVAGRFRAHGVTPTVVQSLSHSHTVLALVDAGRGLAIVPESATRLRHEGFVFRAFADAPDFEVELHLAWRRGSRHSVAERVRHVMLAGFADRGSGPGGPCRGS